MLNKNITMHSWVTHHGHEVQSDKHQQEGACLEGHKTSLRRFASPGRDAAAGGTWLATAMSRLDNSIYQTYYNRFTLHHPEPPESASRRRGLQSGVEAGSYRKGLVGFTISSHWRMGRKLRRTQECINNHK